MSDERRAIDACNAIRRKRWRPSSESIGIRENGVMSIHPVCSVILRMYERGIDNQLNDLKQRNKPTRQRGFILWKKNRSVLENGSG